MIIDLEPLFSGLNDVINIDEYINIPNELLENSSIKKLKDIHLIGKIKRIDELPITIEAKLSGVMTLLDDIDLSEVDYSFDVDIEEELEDNEDYQDLLTDNKLDLISLLWQLIQLEIPSKVHNESSNNKKLSGDGWKLISEEDLNKNNAFSDLDKMLQERSQK